MDTDIPKKGGKSSKRRSKSDISELETRNKFQILDTSLASDSAPEPVKPAPSKPTKASKTPTATHPIPPKQDKIPPIFISDRSVWMETSNVLKARGIAYSRASMVSGNRLYVQPMTVEDYRAMNKLFREELNVKFHTFDIASEKSLKVVLRGVIQEISDAEITEDLRVNGFPAIKVSRMKGRDQQPSPLVYVEIAKDFKSIFDLKYCCGLSIQVEPLKAKTGQTQCHRCQQFGHVQKNCNNDYRCLKCGENHSTHICEKPRQADAVCANCQGNHTANFSKCPVNPNNKQKQLSPPHHITPPTTPWNQIVKGRPQTQHPPPSSPEDSRRKENPREELASALGNMFLSFCELRASESQKIQFLDHTANIIAAFDRK